MNRREKNIFQNVKQGTTPICWALTFPTSTWVSSSTSCVSCVAPSCEELYDILLGCVSRNQTFIQHSPPWFTHELKSLRSLKSRFYKKFQKTKLADGYLNDSALRKMFNHLSTTCNYLHLSKLESELNLGQIHTSFGSLWTLNVKLVHFPQQWPSYRTL